MQKIFKFIKDYQTSAIPKIIYTCTKHCKISIYDIVKKLIFGQNIIVFLTLFILKLFLTAHLTAHFYFFP